MEALWDLEDKLKLTTAKALVLLGGATLAIVGLCILTMLKRKAIKNKVVHQEEDEEEEAATDENESVPAEWSEPSCGWMSVKRVVLMGSMRWCRASKWEEKNAGKQRQRGSPMLSLEKHGHEIGWQSHNSMSAVWQRPILRGEKCELPRFSGLILYDEKGMLLPDSEKETSNQLAMASMQKILSYASINSCSNGATNLLCSSSFLKHGSPSTRMDKYIDSLNLNDIGSFWLLSRM